MAAHRAVLDHLLDSEVRQDLHFGIRAAWGALSVVALGYYFVLSVDMLISASDSFRSINIHTPFCLV